MEPLELLNLSLHLFAAFTWIGSSVFLSLLWLSPVRGSIDPDSWKELLVGLGRRHLRWSWVAIELLILTGIFNLLKVGVNSGFAFQPSFLKRLIGKLLLVSMMIGLQIGLSLVWMPRLVRSRCSGVPEHAVRRALIAISTAGGGALWLAILLHG